MQMLVRTISIDAWLYPHATLLQRRMGGQVGSRARTLLQKFRERRKCVDKSSFSGGATPTSGLYQVRGSDPPYSPARQLHRAAQADRHAPMACTVSLQPAAMIACFSCGGRHSALTSTLDVCAAAQVIMALSLCRNVTVYGFGDGGQGLYQYYK